MQIKSRTAVLPLMFIFWSYWSTNKTVNKNQAVMNPIKKEKTATPTIIGIVRRDDW